MKFVTIFRFRASVTPEQIEELKKAAEHMGEIISKNTGVTVCNIKFDDPERIGLIELWSPLEKTTGMAYFNSMKSLLEKHALDIVTLEMGTIQMGICYKHGSNPDRLIQFFTDELARRLFAGRA